VRERKESKISSKFPEVFKYIRFFGISHKRKIRRFSKCLNFYFRPDPARLVSAQRSLHSLRFESDRPRSHFIFSRSIPSIMSKKGAIQFSVGDPVMCYEITGLLYLAKVRRTFPLPLKHHVSKAARLTLVESPLS
jgi:hypothetical protein